MLELDLFVSDELLEEAVTSLHVWYGAVKRLQSRHVYSFLPVKLKGAMPGTQIEYREADDSDFLTRFFEYGAGPDPFFDPFTCGWLKRGYAHSNISTNRKGTFGLSWGACEWEDSQRLTLGARYHEKIRDEVLRKGKSVVKLPALSLAVWFYKRPSVEWKGRSDLAAGVPDKASDLVELFRQDFHFTNDPGWDVIFDPSPDLLAGYTAGAGNA
jgi:hypothetical protein